MGKHKSMTVPGKTKVRPDSNIDRSRKPLSDENKEKKKNKNIKCMTKTAFEESEKNEREKIKKEEKEKQEEEDKEKNEENDLKTEETLVVRIDDKKRIRANALFLTLKGWHGDEYITYISSKFKTNSIKKWIWSNELGKIERDDKTKYEHTHCLLIFEKQTDIENMRFFDTVKDGKEIHPNIAYARSIPKCEHYIMKDIKRKDRMSEKGKKWNSNYVSGSIEDIIDTIKDAKDVEESIRMSRNLKDVMPIIKIHESLHGKKRMNEGPGYEAAKEIIDKLQLTKWQETTLKMLKANRDDKMNRKVTWIYDPRGKSGKSVLIDYMSMKMQDEVMFITGIIGSKDATEYLKTWIDTHDGLTPKYILWDVMRTHEDSTSIYTCIEMLSGLRVSTAKYGGRSMWKDRSVVAVVSNFLPQTSKLSLDRWDIYKLIGKGYDREMINITDKVIMPEDMKQEDDGGEECNEIEMVSVRRDNLEKLRERLEEFEALEKRIKELIAENEELEQKNEELNEILKSKSNVGKIEINGGTCLPKIKYETKKQGKNKSSEAIYDADDIVIPLGKLF